MNLDKKNITHLVTDLMKDPGSFLVVASFVIIILIMKGSSAIAGVLQYIIIGFAFLIAISGIILLFKQFKSLESKNLVSSMFQGSSIVPTDLSHVVSQLSQNYDILRNQANQGFILAGTIMVLGVCVILIGSVGDLFGFTREGANLTTIAGLIIEAVSGIGFFLFKKTFDLLRETSDKLHSTWKLLAAFDKAEKLPEDKKADTIVMLLTKLVE